MLMLDLYQKEPRVRLPLDTKQMAQFITVELNGLEFEVPVKSAHSWSQLTDWILEVNETLENLSEGFIIPAGTANLVDGSPVNLYTVNAPADNSGIFFEYTITRITTGGSGVSVGETGTLIMKYNSVAGTWIYTNYGVGDASVALSVSGANIIQATATALAGIPSVSTITYKGRIIRT